MSEPVEIEIGLEDDFAEAEIRRVEAGGTSLAVVRIGDDLYAIGDLCSHAKASLAEGEVDAEERSVECPRHGATFDVSTGEALSLPATASVPAYRVVSRDGVAYAILLGANV